MSNSNEISVRDIQNKMLEILIYFRDFCEANDLKFTLCGGTCLGAVRHGGFIPWDDDVDVFMLREDYEKLQGLWEKNADTSRYSCVRSNETINIHHSATEIKDNNTTFINRHSAASDINHGLMIDVIPIDGIPKAGWRKTLQMIDAMIYCCFNFQRCWVYSEDRRSATKYGKVRKNAFRDTERKTAVRWPLLVRARPLCRCAFRHSGSEM